MLEHQIDTISVDLCCCEIEKVVVYQSGARVARKLQLDLAQAGSYRVVIEGISADCDATSLTVHGGEGCRIEEIATETIKKRREDLKTQNRDATKREIDRLISELEQLVVSSNL